MKTYTAITPVVGKSTILRTHKIGDSITAGGVVTATDSGYRAEFAKALRDLGIVEEGLGTFTSNNTDTPSGYPRRHEGNPNDTIALLSARTVGTWGGGGGFTLASADAPAAGSRGSAESVAIGPFYSLAAPAGIVQIIHAGTNDATSGTVDRAAYELWLKRLYAVGNVYGGVRMQVICQIIGRTGNAGASTRTDAFNATFSTTAANLTAAGIPVVVADCAAGFDTATMLADPLHPNTAGKQFMASRIIAAMQSAGLF